MTKLFNNLFNQMNSINTNLCHGKDVFSSCSISREPEAKDYGYLWANNFIIKS